MAGVMGFLAPILAAIIGLLLWFARVQWERRQKRNDILIGLHAEIVAGGHATQQQIEDKDYAIANKTPFATPDRTDFVFESIKDDISILPEGVIYEVVRYYRLAAQTNLMTADLREPVFIAQNDDEREKFIRALIAKELEQAFAAEEALDRIETFIWFQRSPDITRRLRRKRAEAA